MKVITVVINHAIILIISTLLKYVYFSETKTKTIVFVFNYFIVINN